ncbi:MAG: hypothetical protein IIT86_00370 [Oscillospiraceae bacterium]|nr:hypothetical protein [Oscillospiraceae bacterium]
MKHKISIILAVAVILSVLTGCSKVGKQASTVVESEEGTVLIVRIINQSAVNLYGIAARCCVNDITLGSKVCEQINNNTGQVVYEFDFAPDELPTTSIDSFRLDVFAAEKAGEDFSDCGSAVINSPQPGGVYTLVLNGEKATALTLSTAEEVVEILPPALTAQTELSVDSLVGPWHLVDDTDLETLSEVFPGAAEFGSGMEIRSDGRISWYIGADGAMGTYVMEGNTLTADVTGELDGVAYRITLHQPESEKLVMTFKEIELVWTYGEGDSLRGED